MSSKNTGMSVKGPLVSYTPTSCSPGVLNAFVVHAHGHYPVEVTGGIGVENVVAPGELIGGFPPPGPVRASESGSPSTNSTAPSMGFCCSSTTKMLRVWVAGVVPETGGSPLPLAMAGTPASRQRNRAGSGSMRRNDIGPGFWMGDPVCTNMNFRPHRAKNPLPLTTKTRFLTAQLLSKIREISSSERHTIFVETHGCASLAVRLYIGVLR